MRHNQFPINVLGRAPRVVLDSSLGDSIFNASASQVTGLSLDVHDNQPNTNRAHPVPLSPLNGGGSALPEMEVSSDSTKLSNTMMSEFSLSAQSASRSRLLASMENDSNSFLPFIRLAAASARASVVEKEIGPEDSVDEDLNHEGGSLKESLVEQHSREQEMFAADKQNSWDGEHIGNTN